LEPGSGERRYAAVPRFFVEGVHAVGERVALRGDDARKLSVVLRARAGQRVEVCDSAGNAFGGLVVLEGPAVEVELVERLTHAAEPQIELILAQAIPKGAKMDFVIEKATELGVARIVPIVTERTIADAGRPKVERWRRLARSAAQQSGRVVIPEIDEPIELRRFVENAGAMRLLLPWELAQTVPLRERLPALIADARSIAVVIGPEGGFSHAEVEHAVNAGAVPLSLGSRILRTESAGLVLLSAILYAAAEI